MNSFKKTIQNLGLEGWIFGLTGLIAIIFSVVSFLGVTPPVEQTLQIIVGGVGALMLAVVAQTSRRHAEIQELKSAVGIAESELLDRERELGPHLLSRILKTNRFVSDTSLASARPSYTSDHGFSGSEAEYHRLLYDRVKKGEITYRYVTVIFHQQRLEDVLLRLLLHEGENFYVRHYEPPPEAIPIVNLMSFDDDAFYLGGFHTGSPSGGSQVLFTRDPNLLQLFQGYWNTLWVGGIPLNEGKIIDWQELKKIALKLEMAESEFDSMVDKVKNEAQTWNQQLQR